MSICISENHVADIKAAGRAVAAAEADHKRAAAPLVAAAARGIQAATRLGALESRRAAIVARRAAGDHQPDDGGELALIGADSEGLAAMVARAEAEERDARGAAEEASMVVSNAREHLRQIEEQAEHDALVQHAAALDMLLADTARRLNDFQRRRGGRPEWGPSADLRDALRRLSSMRGEL